jgi:hypothetical protein
MREEVLRRANAGGVEVKLGPPASLIGALIGVEAERLAHARVRARLADQTQPYWSTHDREFETAVVDGHYTFASLAPGLYTILLDDPQGARLVLPQVAGFGVVMENSVDPLEVELLPGATIALDLTVTAGAVLEGLVLDEHRARWRSFGARNDRAAHGQLPRRLHRARRERVALRLRLGR